MDIWLHSYIRAYIINNFVLTLSTLFFWASIAPVHWISSILTESTHTASNIIQWFAQSEIILHTITIPFWLIFIFSGIKRKLIISPMAGAAIATISPQLHPSIAFSPRHTTLLHSTLLPSSIPSHHNKFIQHIREGFLICHAKVPMQLHMKTMRIKDIVNYFLC